MERLCLNTFADGIDGSDFFPDHLELVADQ